MSEAINIKEKLSQFSTHWDPHIIAEMDNYDIKLTKLLGDFVFHAHADEDEMFLVIKGRFRMDYEDHQAWLEEGEMVVVPKGVVHKPHSPEECHVLMIEKQGLINTGEADDDRRVEKAKKL
ncbi:MAG: cupin domain-containing protein [Sphingomonadales bacterium]|nr:cupin domain-containing protein [Sphingomonadales bacterium]